MKFIIAVLSTTILLCTLPAAAQGDPDAGKSKARSCAACHGQDGNSPLPTMYPSIAGIDSATLQQKLHDYRAGNGGSGPMAASMVAMAKPLSDADIADLAAFFSQQSKR